MEGKEFNSFVRDCHPKSAGSSMQTAVTSGSRTNPMRNPGQPKTTGTVWKGSPALSLYRENFQPINSIFITIS